MHENCEVLGCTKLNSTELGTRTQVHAGRAAMVWKLRISQLSAILFPLLVWAACSNSHSVTVTITAAPPTTMGVDAVANVTATVSNDSSNAGVDWSATCGSGSVCGSFNPTHTNSGSPTVYTAPSTIPAGNTVTITATSTAQHSAFAQANTTIATGVTTISVSFAVAPPQYLPVSQSTALTAIVTNDTTSAGVDWTVSCASTGACGSITPTHTTGSAFASYTAPSTIPSGNTVTITAASTADPAATVNATIFIAAGNITVSFATPPPATLGVNSSVTVSANVANDNTDAGVDWTVTCGTPGSCGSVNPAHTASSGATVYTAPSSVPFGSTVTITATSTANSAGTVSGNVTIQ